MQRRDILKTAAFTSLSASGSMLAQTPANAAPKSRRARPDVETRDGARLFLRDWGEGKPVLFLHGWALASDMWAYQMPPMTAAGFRCIAYDRRGHGRSSDPGRGYDYDALAGDLDTVLTTLGVNDVTLVGHSFAAGEMVRYLTKFGDRRVSRLVFVSPAATPGLARSPANPGGVDPAVFEHLRNEVFLEDFPKWLDEGAAAYFTPETSNGIVAWTRQTMLQASMLAVIECNRAMTGADFRAELPHIAVPSLVVHGTKDASAPVEITGAPTAAMIPGAELALYQGAPHGLYVTHHRRLTEDLIRFIGG